jgi:hypothetical protein
MGSLAVVQILVPLDSSPRLAPTPLRAAGDFAQTAEAGSQDWPAILERPLVAPDRRMIRAAAPGFSVDGYVVVGIAASDTAASAVLRDPDGMLLRLLPGRIVKGWTVEGIESGRVILGRAGQRRVLPLDLKRLRAAADSQAKGTSR